MVSQKKKIKKQIRRGVVTIHTTSNNTIVTLADLLGNTVCWSSTGSIGYKGSRKKTPFAAQMAAKALAIKALELGMKEAEFHIRGRGGGRDTALRAFKNMKIAFVGIEDKTPVPHNGCRPPKKRRL
jgi:small subunit ribosomal protein S11